jgi:secreted trypsin-like serine protease
LLLLFFLLLPLLLLLLLSLLLLSLLLLLSIDLLILTYHNIFGINIYFIYITLAVIKLDTPVNYDRIVQPICLLNSRVEFSPGKECYVTGWGHTQFNGTQPDALNEAKVKLVSSENCNKNESYAGKIHGRSLCAGFEEGGVDACQYDSGGPLACQYYRRYYLTGIVSWGHGCASPHKYGVYSNVKVMTSWVIDNIRGNDSAWIIS